ncbi:uncharacterized protein TNCT_157841 [Trichonephila clavata]|uniref:Uncharacterized protein n=1 Tax=Trichonephila clavata TaxID=2740835 RepID=A0A8X6HKM6_TRICU|nr:uncharacterized protein TNCT_157841 [Trichonephila clavata]
MKSSIAWCPAPIRWIQVAPRQRMLLTSLKPTLLCHRASIVLRLLVKSALWSPATDTLEPEPKITYSHGDSADHQDKMHLSSRTEESMAHSSKGALECKLKELQSTNGAKQQMEMFLSKLTDESVLMDDFTSHSFPDILDDSEQQSAPDDFLQSIEAAQGVSSSGS